jgi:hypothetical protein
VGHTLLIAAIDGGRDDPPEQFGHRRGRRIAQVAPAATMDLPDGRPDQHHDRALLSHVDRRPDAAT